MSTLKDKIKAAQDLITRSRPIPEWDVDVELRSPTVGTRRDIVKRYTTTNADGDTEVDLVEMQFALMLAMVFEPGAEVGATLFDDVDTEWLVDKNGDVVWTLAQECMELAGFVGGDATESAEEAQIDAGKASSSETAPSETS